MLNQYQYEAIYNVLQTVVNHLMQTQRIPVPIGQQILKDFNPQYGNQQQRLSLIIEKAFPPNTWIGGQGPQQSQVMQLLGNQVLQWAELMMRQAQQPQSGGVWAAQPGQGYLGSGFPQQTAPRAGYDHGLGVMEPPPIAAAAPAQVRQDNPLWTDQARDNLGGGRGVFPRADADPSSSKMESTAMSTPQLATADMADAEERELFLPPGHGFHRVQHLSGQTDDNISVTHLCYDAVRPANDAFEVFRRLWPYVGEEYLPLGRWSIAVNYDRLMCIPTLGLKRYQELAEIIRGKLDSTRSPIYAALEGLGTCTRHEYNTFQIAMVREINQGLMRWARTNKRPDNIIEIESLDDVPALARKLEGLSETGGRRANALTSRILDTLAQQMFLDPDGLIRQKYPPGRRAGGGDNIGAVIGPNDGARGDLMTCNAIEVDLDAHPGLDKINALLLAAEDRDKIFAEILERHTVVRIPDTIVVQNVHTDDRGLLTQINIDAFGRVKQDPRLIGETIRRAGTIYGIKPGVPPAKSLTQFTPVNTLEGDFYLMAIRGIPGLG